VPRRKSNGSGPLYYTTWQVAKEFGVSLPTVVNWVNSGLLRAHRTPGGHRRIAHHDLLAFARDNDYPVTRALIDALGTRRRILVVDDEPDFSEMVREYLKLKGDFEVEVAGTGFLAGYAVARFRPDLILLDLPMPDMDGFEVNRTLRADPETRHVPVIACMAFRDPEIDRRVREARFDGVLDKPLKLERLLELVRERLDPAISEGT
jgi:excisionase family DNA binding protein